MGWRWGIDWLGLGVGLVRCPYRLVPRHRGFEWLVWRACGPTTCFPPGPVATQSGLAQPQPKRPRLAGRGIAIGQSLA
jgi:hypothetical protein